MIDPIERLLAALDAIEPVPATEKAFLRPLLRTKTLAKGDFFLRPDRPAHHIGYLVSGLLRYYYVSSEGKEFIKHFCFDGHFIASTTHGTTDYYVEALEATTVVTFAQQDWLGLLGRHPVWGLINARVQAEALLRAEVRERSLILDSAQDRYLALLDEVPGIEARVRQYDLSHYLGITPVALSRIRGRPAPK